MGLNGHTDRGGNRLDLAIALGILCAQKAVPARSLENTEFLGELSLNGGLRPVPGVLPAALRAVEAGNAVVVPPARPKAPLNFRMEAGGDFEEGDFESTGFVTGA